MGIKAVRYLLLGQISLWAALLVCVLLMPSVVYSNNGVSHFGVHARTILPYGVGFLLCGYLTIHAAHEIRRVDRVSLWLSRALSLLALFLLGILLTPFSINAWLDWLHMIAGGLLFFFELVLGVWLVVLWRDGLNFGLFGLQAVGSVMAALSLWGLAELMFTGQLVAEVAFGTLLVRVAARVITK